MPAHSSLRHPKKTLMKASSFDVLRQLSFDQGNVFIRSNPRRPASSGNLIAQIAKCCEHESSLTFQVGSAKDDDVFIDRSASRTESRDSFSKETEYSGEEASTGSQDQTPKIDGNWSLVPREPLQVDAQNIYPSSACVFVANLTQSFDDRRLEIEVTKHFSQFGTVFVKIRRDSRQMPFAFCQFTCDTDAIYAEKHGNGTVILGRPCRIEKATAHSCFVVYKLSGAETTRQEAIDLLGILGPIAKVHPLNLDSQKTENSPPAMVVHYKRYDSSRSVIKAFEGHPVFRVDAYDPKTEMRQQHKKNDQQSYAQYEKDRRSAYFGNLPLYMTADVLKSLASQCGKVLCVEVATKEVPQVGGRTAKTCFGFVEFARPDSIDDAIINYHRKSIDGHIIKVERKRTRTFNGLSHGTNSSQRGSFAGVPSTWHGTRGGNGGGSGSRIMNANTFIPPATGLPATCLLNGADNQQDSMVSPTNADGSYPPSQTRARRYDHSNATKTAINEGSSVASVRLPTTPKCSSTRLLTVLGHVEETEIGKIERQSAKKGKGETRQKKLLDNIDVKKEQRGLESIQNIVETTSIPVSFPDDSYQSKPSERLCNSKDIGPTNSVTKEDKTTLETPPESPVKSTAKSSPAYGAESAASCFYPFIHPYSYSPYGYHAIQSLMTNPMVSQGGPIMYNSFGQAYYSPTPYADMYTMYPMLQQYPAAAVETPTRPSTSSYDTKNEQQKSRNEAYGMPQESDDKTGGATKEKAH
ncbi:hypothetical protein V8C35DRAFT_330243 [Trichoderma chlorosporum]